MLMSADTPPDSSAPPPSATPRLTTREIDSRELMQGDREIAIRHGQEIYRLSVTRAGKLILRK